MRKRSLPHPGGGSMIAIAALAIGMTMAVPAASHAQTAHVAAASSASASNLYGGPRLDGLDVTMAYDRLNGTTPDFRPYAERSGVYLNATVFDRPAVLDREIARMKAAFAAFEMNRVYSLSIRVQVQQYDPQRQGYPLDFGPSSTIPLADPVTFHGYALAFRNADDADLVSVGDAAAARAFAERNGFDMQNASAGQAALQLALRLVDAPPTLDGSPDTVRADILAARLLGQDGSVIHDFGNLASQPPPSSRAAAGAAADSVLKTADVQGFHVGMSADDAMALGTRGWKTRLGPDGSTVIGLFDGLQPSTPTWATCGSLQYGSPDVMAVYSGNSVAPSYRSCIGLRLDGPAPPGAFRRVDALVSRQHLGAADAGKVLAELKAKYGSPVYVRNAGSNLVWLGRDPSRSDGVPLQITANVGDEIDANGTRETVLTVEEKLYADPRPKPAVQATATAAKL